MPGARRVLGLARGLVPALALVALVFPASVLVREGTAAAEEPKLEYADGPTACREFVAKNERQLAQYSKSQPATPYEYPRDDTVLGAPWGPLTEGAGKTIELLAASVVPHVGAQLRVETPAAVVSWPWSLPFGPAYACSRKRGTYTVDEFRFHRLMVEPGLVASTRGLGVFFRSGYRFLYHPTDWVVGVGGGLGSTIELTGNREPTRASLGPEAVMQFGRCCGPNYFTFAVRYDRYFAGEALNIVWGSLGYTFF